MVIFTQVWLRFSSIPAGSSPRSWSYQGRWGGARRAELEKLRGPQRVEADSTRPERIRRQQSGRCVAQKG